MGTKKYIKLTFQKPNHEFGSKTTYELEACYLEVDESVSYNEQYSKLYEMAYRDGADPRKLSKVSIISEQEYVVDVFESIKDDVTDMCSRWGKKGRNGQTLYGDVMDWMRDMYDSIYRSSYCDMFARLIIGEYVIKNRLL